jgi:hypothetical protein
MYGVTDKTRLGSVSRRAERGATTVPGGAEHVGDPAQALLCASGPQSALRVPQLWTRTR